MEHNNDTVHSGAIDGVFVVEEEIAKTLDAAFLLLSSIPVRGDSVDVMADVRAKLRYAYQLTKTDKEEAENG